MKSVAATDFVKIVLFQDPRPPAEFSDSDQARLIFSLPPPPPPCDSVTKEDPELLLVSFSSDDVAASLYLSLSPLFCLEFFQC